MQLLKNTKILITRQSASAQSLCTQIILHGGQPICMPLFAIESLVTPIFLHKLKKSLSKSTLVVCISRNAAELILPQLVRHPNLRWATVGRGTAQLLQLGGVEQIIHPLTAPYDSKALVQQLKLSSINLANQYIIILTGAGGNNWLINELTRHGAGVEVWPIYRRVLPSVTNEQVKTSLACGIDLMLITCVTSLTNLVNLAATAQIEVRNIPLLVVSDRIREQAVVQGFTQIFLTKSMEETDILNAMLAFRAA